MTDQEELNFAIQMEKNMFSWNCDGVNITIPTAPKEATELPKYLHDGLVKEYLKPSGPIGVAWTEKTGWVGLAGGQGPFVWYVQKDRKD